MIDNLSIIAAIGKNNELGVNNSLIWHLPTDLKYFKKTTYGKTIVMGRKCFESLPGLLPNRTHIIMTNNKDYKVDGATIYHNVEDVLNYINKSNEECFIIGGAKIYELFMPYAKKLYLTEINADAEADVYFPIFNKELYEKEEIEEINENNINYKFVIYTRRNNG